ncbi:MAG: DUF2807 domain-containing protein [Ignavibacteriales bacterium]|nr:DUF2807 domain-containing protein [Ignavibacteriales bacterium]
MKKENFVIISFIITTILITYASSLAEDKTEKFDYKDFKKVEVGWGMHVKINQSNLYSVEVKADESDFKYLKVEKSHETLKFYIDKRNWHPRDDIYITITTPELIGLELSGGSEGRIKMDASEKPFDCELSGGSALKGELKCADISVNLSGGSEVSLSGNAKDLKIEGSCGSEIKLKEFLVSNVNADLSGGSEVTINMNGKLNVDASGGSEVTFYGKAEYGHSDLSGGSSVTQGK